MAQHDMDQIGVIGAGSWGTTLANLLAEKGYGVDLWVREEEVHQQIKEERVNSVFLPDRELSRRLKPVRSHETALSGKQLILMAVPSHVFRGVLSDMKPHLKQDMTLIVATKGIENDSLMTMSQVTASLLPETFLQNYACLTGPSFAREVSLKHPTAITIGCPDLEHGKILQRVFNTDFFRVYVTPDLIGVELCGALKNVIAIAAGIGDGLNFGHNARAALITRGLAEITRLGVAMGANPLTFAGLAGLGDLVLTCTGDLSRNRTVGLRIGEGMKLKEIVDRMHMVAEGVKTSVSAYHLAKKMNVEMPITEQVYKVLHEDKDPREAVRALMTRALKVELEH